MRHFSTPPTPLVFKGFYVLIGIYLLLIASLPFCPWMEKRMMSKFHLRSTSFPEWAVLQFAPSMYSFANQIWVTEKPVTPAQILAGSPETPVTLHLWTNHYPFWPVTFLDRQVYVQPHKDYYITLRSQFRSQDLWTSYHLDAQGRWMRISP